MCTTDGCNEGADVCTHAGNSLPCNDGDPCTTDDTCSNEVCSGTPLVPCTTTTTDAPPTTTTDAPPTTTTVSTTSTTLPGPLCGDANDDGDIKSGDALIALKTAVGTESCAPVRCDYNGDGKVRTGDALLILQAAVGTGVEPQCPPEGPGGDLVLDTSSTTTTHPAAP